MSSSLKAEARARLVGGAGTIGVVACRLVESCAGRGAASEQWSLQGGADVLCALSCKRMVLDGYQISWHGQQ